MSMLAFMPWCPIQKTYEVGTIRIIPVEPHARLEYLEDAERLLVNTILATYKTIEGNPVDHAGVVQYVGKSPVADVSEDERDDIRELVTLACFGGLARREHFNPLGNYCNSDCFLLFFQRFDHADFTAITTRRCEGQTWSAWPLDSISISIPVHCHVVREVILDEPLLVALLDHRSNSGNHKWGKWQNALTCFNRANTDSDNIYHQVEWVLLCSAFEHILDAKSDARDVADRFAEAMKPTESLLVGQAGRKSVKWAASGQTLRYEWMREFYRIRGDFAHGKLKTSNLLHGIPLNIGCWQQ